MLTAEPQEDRVVKMYQEAAIAMSIESRKSGHQAGREWAEESPAKIAELKQLEKAVLESDGNGNGNPEYLIGVFENGSNQGAAVGLYEAIEGPKYDRGGVFDTANCYWESVLGEGGGERLSDQAFAQGFVEGAHEVWERVKVHL